VEYWSVFCRSLSWTTHSRKQDHRHIAACGISVIRAHTHRLCHRHSPLVACNNVKRNVLLTNLPDITVEHVLTPHGRSTGVGIRGSLLSLPGKWRSRHRLRGNTPQFPTHEIRCGFRRCIFPHIPAVYHSATHRRLQDTYHPSSQQSRITERLDKILRAA